MRQPRTLVRGLKYDPMAKSRSDDRWINFAATCRRSAAFLNSSIDFLGLKVKVRGYRMSSRPRLSDSGR